MLSSEGPQGVPPSEPVSEPAPMPPRAPLLVILDEHGGDLLPCPGLNLEDVLPRSRALGVRVSIVRRTEGEPQVYLAHSGPGGWRGPHATRKVSPYRRRLHREYQ